MILLAAIAAYFYKPLRSVHHNRARLIILVTALLILADAILFARAEHIPYWHAIYVTLANAETFGGDVAPSTPWGYVANSVVCILLIPLVGAVASLFISGLSEEHVKKATADIKQHMTDKTDEQTRSIKRHVSSATGSED